MNLYARIFALLLASFLCLPSAAQIFPGDRQIREAIEINTADAETTRLAKEKLRGLIRQFRMLGGDLAAQHLEHFMGQSGIAIDYGPNHRVSQAVRRFADAEFSHAAAHQHALVRIMQYLESEIRGGRRDFPNEIPLSNIGFTATGTDRLQGPNVYEAGAVFRVPIYPPENVNMAAAFGDFQGPHEGVIRNLQVVETPKPEGGSDVQLNFEVHYTWVDQYTFNNDGNMSSWDAAAHYLEFIAHEAKTFRTSVQASESVAKSVELSAEEAARGPGPDGGNGSDGEDPKGENPNGENPNGENPNEEDPSGETNPGNPPRRERPSGNRRRYTGVLRLPKNVPGWKSGQVKNLDDIEYDIEGPAASNSTLGSGNRPGSRGGDNGSPSGNNGDDNNGGDNNGGDGQPNDPGTREDPGANGDPSTGDGGMAGQVNEETLSDLSAWRDLLSFRPPTAIQQSVQSVGESWTVHRVEDGLGAVNLDYYPVTIKRLPVVNGREVPAEVLLSHIRRNINDFVDNDLSTFAPFKPTDATRWNSNNATGTNIQIDVKLPLDTVDYAMVVAAKHTPQEWVFSTVRGGSGWWAINDRNSPGAHPVSGNRAFGYRREADGTYTFYTMGADRATRRMDWIGSPIGFVMADRLWRSYQQSIVEFVNTHGGLAQVDYDNTVSQGHDWEEVKEDPNIYDPSTQPAWVPVPVVPE